MFERARLTLTAWYVGALVLTVVGIGAVSYRLLRDDLQSEIDDSLQTAARELSATGGLVPAAPSPTPTPDAGGSDDHDDDEDHDDDSGHALLAGDRLRVDPPAAEVVRAGSGHQS